MQKVLRVNTKTGEINCSPVAEKYRTFGKRGLIDRVLSDEVNPKCDALGPENKLIICTGTFAGTTLPAALRVSVGGKSPLTGTIKESSVGGMMGPMMFSQGIKMIVLEDKPADERPWKILHVDSAGKPSLIDASQLAGLGTYAVCEKMFEQYSNNNFDNIAVMTLGPAGEMLYKSASVMVTEFGSGHPCRAAGRGGLGALMGSKKIKAVVVEKASNKAQFEYADKQRFDAARIKFVEAYKDHPRIKMFSDVGTANLINFSTPLGIIPHKNFSGQHVSDEQKQKFTTENWKESGTAAGGKTGVPCQPGCIMKCSNIYHDKDGKFLTAGFEYETIAMLGPNIDVYDFYEIAKFDYQCDDIGIDTIEAGTAIGVCMEGGKLKWGDIAGVHALLDEMRRGTEFGRLLGQGTEAVGKALGVKRIPVVKGQGVPAYDPRMLKGNGITYAVSTQGADHTFGIVNVPTATDEQVPDMAFESQTRNALTNDFLCLFITVLIMEDPAIVPELYAGAFGGEWTVEKCREMAKETLKIERMFNERAGFTAADDCLPEFFRKPGYEGGPAFHFTDEQVQAHINSIYQYK